VGRWQGSSLNRFHFLGGIFLGQLYAEGFLSKSMVLGGFTLFFLSFLYSFFLSIGIMFTIFFPLFLVFFLVTRFSFLCCNSVWRKCNSNSVAITDSGVAASQWLTV